MAMMEKGMKDWYLVNRQQNTKSNEYAFVQ